MDEKIFALIEDGVCTNTIVADDKFAASIGYIACPDGFGIGDYYDGSTWAKQELPEPPPPQPDIMDSILLAMAELFENQLRQEQEITANQEALVELYESTVGGE